MLDFAVIGLPRSGTTWAANWLTTDRSICLHDPLANQTLDQLAEWGEQGGRVRGVACTALWMFPEWLKANVRKVVVVERPIEQINQSLVEIGLSPLAPGAVDTFQRMPGLRADMAALFSPSTAAAIWGHLLDDIPFDAERHRLLTTFMVNPYFEGWEPDPAAVKDWMARVHKAAA